MKKLTYLLSVLTLMVFMSCSCEKDDPVPEPQTLEDLYPDWADLSWVSTDDVSESDTYPQLNITIVGDLVTITHEHSAPDPDLNAYVGTYNSMSIIGSTVTFTDSPDPNGIQTVTGLINSNDGVEISLNSKGLSTTSHTFILLIKQD